MKGCLVLLLCAVAGVWQAHAQFRFGGSCFGISTYDPSSKTFCCKGNSYPAGANANAMGCCGKHLVSKTTNLCCSNDPFPKGPGMKCCDKTYINVETQICCDGEALFRMEGVKTMCCGKKAYSPSAYACCNSDLIPVADAKNNVACIPGNDADQIVNNMAPPRPSHPPRHASPHPPHHPPHPPPPPRHASHAPNVFMHGPPPPPFPRRGPPPPGFGPPPPGFGPPPPGFGPPPPPQNAPAPGGGRPPGAFEIMQRLQRMMSSGGRLG